MSRTIYVNMDALLVRSDEPDPHLGAGIAPYANAFMRWAAQHGHVCLLTDGPLSHAMYLAGRIGNPSVRGFTLSKTELLDPHQDVYLVDDALIPSEMSWFAEHGLHHRVITVNPREGVTAATKDKLEARLRDNR